MFEVQVSRWDNLFTFLEISLFVQKLLHGQDLTIIEKI